MNDQHQWPELPWRDWEPTISTVHMWTQIVGKIALALKAPINHWWHIPFNLAARGLMTTAIPYRDGEFRSGAVSRVMTDPPDGAIGSRQPAWSDVLTRPLVRLIPASAGGQALIAIKAIHTALFFSIAAALGLTLWDGVRGRPSRRTAIAGGVVAVETVTYLSNNRVCPLTPLAELFGATRGSVVDMFLPAAVARRIPLVAGSAALLSIGLNVRALLRS